MIFATSAESDASPADEAGRQRLPGGVHGQALRQEARHALLRVRPARPCCGVISGVERSITDSQ